MQLTAGIQIRQGFVLPASYSTSPEHTFLDADLEDSRAKLQLNVQPLVISSLLEHIRKDSELLAEHNLMDYSLLIGLVSKQHRCFGSKCVCTFGTNGRWVLNGNIVIGDTEVQLERCHCYTDECKVSKTNSEKKGKEKAGKKKHGAEKKHGDHKATKREHVGKEKETKELGNRLAVFIGIIDVLQPYNTSKKVYKRLRCDRRGEVGEGVNNVRYLKLILTLPCSGSPRHQECYLRVYYHKHKYVFKNYN